MTALGLLDEADAEGKVAEVYDRIRRGFQIDFVPNFFKAQAARPQLLEATWNSAESILVPDDGIPRSVKEMMFVAISKANECAYCEAAHMAFCKILGVEKDSRDELVQNIASIRPLRTRAIIQFAVKCGAQQNTVTSEDLQTLQDHGLTDAEIQEAIAMSSFARYANIIADSLQVPIDEDFRRILDN